MVPDYNPTNMKYLMKIIIQWFIPDYLKCFPCINLSGANLRECILSNAQLALANLTSADISGVNLTECTLEGAELIHCVMTTSNKQDAISVPYNSPIVHPNLTRAKFTRVNLAYCFIMNAN